MRGPRDKKDEQGGGKPPRGGRALERLRAWERARGFPKRPPDTGESEQAQGGAAEEGCESRKDEGAGA
jgi:hypothetical protein